MHAKQFSLASLFQVTTWAAAGCACAGLAARLWSEFDAFLVTGFGLIAVACWGAGLGSLWRRELEGAILAVVGTFAALFFLSTI